MITYSNECVDCGLPCLGSSCPYRNVPHYYCDNCGKELVLFAFSNEEISEDCVGSEDDYDEDETNNI